MSDIVFVDFIVRFTSLLWPLPKFVFDENKVGSLELMKFRSYFFFNR
jgi:hypothetical protein